MYKAVFMAVYNCSTNCLFIDDGLLQSLFPNWILNDHRGPEWEWLYLKGDESRLSMFTCVYCMCVWVCQQSIIKYLSFPAGLSHCILFSLSIRICLKHLTADFSCSGIGLFGFWSHFVPTLILMNWLHKALRQHTLSSVINAQIHSFLFIWGGVGAFQLPSRWAPGLWGNCPLN